MNGPSPREPHGRRPLPARSDWRRALDVYVAGRSAVLTADQKRRIAGPGRPADSPNRRPVSGTDGIGPPEPAYGIPVPRVLDFYRNAGTWRDGLPRPASRGEEPSDA